MILPNFPAHTSLLVTGAAGFVGAGVARRLLELGHAVVGLDNLNEYYDVRLKHHRLQPLLAHPRFTFYELDLRHPNALETVFSAHTIGAVINLAAQAGVRYSLLHPQLYYETNVMGVLHLLEAMRRYGTTKFLLASTSSLYSQGVGPYREDQPVHQPRSPYAASKRAAELLAYTYHYQYGIDVSVLRYFTVYGPAGRPDMSILRFIHWLATGQPLHIYGDGRQARDFTYIDDIVEGTIQALRPLGYEIINLGGGEVIPLWELIDQLAARLGASPRLVYYDAQSSDLERTWADTSLARELLGWQAAVDFRTGLDRTVAWYRANQDWVVDLHFHTD